MFSFSVRRKEERLRQECAEWFAVHLGQMLTYARQQADASTDVELLVTTVAGNVTRAVCEGRVSVADLHPYALRSIWNTAARLREQNARRSRTEQGYGEQLYSLPQHPAADANGPDDTRLKLRRALHELPEELGCIVTLRIWDELTFPDISARLGLAESTVRSRYSAALKQMKRKISTP
ncbi:MAG: sigma-70 family RNA polymerase sigma factor [Akkermansia sp.]|nr:sigma-70 family RNA polymerase sigma factor [Akkermansia sp.]